MLNQKITPRSLSDIVDDEIRKDPYSLYASIRDNDPVHWDEKSGTWALMGYEDVASTFGDERLSKAIGLKKRFDNLPESVQLVAIPAFEFLWNTPIYSDPPQHTRLRGLAQRAFTPKAVNIMRDSIQKTVDELFDAVADKAEIDIIHDLAFPLPAIVICDMIGLPLDAQEDFKRWSDDIAGMITAVNYTPERMESAGNSAKEVSQFISDLSHERRLNPQDDLLSALISIEEQGDRLSHTEMVANTIALLIGGHETTTNLLGNGTLALLQHPEQLEKLKNNPELLLPAVEEMLRYDSPVQMVYRSLTEDMQIGDKQLHEGDIVNLVIGAANRDPDEFEQPDNFDISRMKGKHIAFGLGIHFCIGAALARLEGQIFFSTLLRRYPDLKLITDDVEWHNFVNFRSLRSLTVLLH